jgi:hypothetical protein
MSAIRRRRGDWDVIVRIGEISANIGNAECQFEGKRGPIE